MEMQRDEPVRIALLDLNKGTPNQGIRSLRALVDAEVQRGADLRLDTFDVRQEAAVPDLTYHAYISSGGPGSPFDGEGSAWETRYFEWLDALWQHNARTENGARKHALFICHSFQMMCRHFQLGAVTKRDTQSFGIVPVHRTARGQSDPLLNTLTDPFFAADFRWWQVVQPNHERLQELGAEILALEQQSVLPRERAVMGIRLSREMAGVQFHPEANPEGMLVHFQEPERRNAIVEKFGEDRHERLIRRLNDPNYLAPTLRTIVPAFLCRAITDARTAPRSVSQ